jgi:hypothetical protein
MELQAIGRQLLELERTRRTTDAVDGRILDLHRDRVVVEREIQAALQGCRQVG